MALNTNQSYQKLTHHALLIEGEDGEFLIKKKVVGREKSFPKVRKVYIKRRLMRVKIPSLKRFLNRKTRFIVASFAKVVKRLKESQSHFGDLFAGNYLFMQVTPTPFKYADKYMKKGIDLSGIPYRGSVPRISQCKRR